MANRVIGSWEVNKKKSHPWVVECETNVPGVKGEVAVVSYKPYAHLIAAAPDQNNALIYARCQMERVRSVLNGEGKEKLTKKDMEMSLYQAIMQADMAIKKARVE
jgi:hypothetical protein